MKMRHIEDSYRLSSMQQEMLLHSLHAPQAGVDSAQLIIRLYEELNVSAFRQAWQRVVERHPVLRTTFRWEGLDEPLQEVHQRVNLPLNPQDWRDLSPQERESRLEAYLQSDRRRGFELSEAPLMRLALFRLAETDYQLIWTFHHALLDGQSLPLVLNEVFAFYEAFCQGQDLQLKQPRPYRDYIDWLGKQDFTKAKHFWRETLNGLTAATPLVVDHAYRAKSHEEEGCGEQEIRLSEALTSALQSLAQGHQLTLNTLVQGAWALLLSRYSGEEDVVFGATRACRRSALEGEGTESMVGIFINTLPVRVHLPAEMPLLPWLKELRAQWIAVREYEHTPLVKVQEWSDTPSGEPLFESLLVFESDLLNSTFQAQSEGWEKRTFRLLEPTNHPLTVVGYGEPELLLKIKYDLRRFDEGTIARMLGHVMTLLEGMVANPERRLSDLQMLTEAERQQLLMTWNNTHADYPKDMCIHKLFEAQVEHTPDAVAVVFEDERLTYRQLNRRANQLAHYLQERGVGPEALVGICMERSLEMVVGLLGVLKAGGAYVPLDPAYPAARLAFMLEDTSAPVLLTQQCMVEGLPDHEAEVVCLDTDWEAIAQESEESLAGGSDPDNLAYVIYTSGSTGKPKGVAIEHHSTVALLCWAKDILSSDEFSSVLASTSICFDLSVFELFFPLSWGGKAILAKNVLQLPNLPSSQEVTLINTVPSAIAGLLRLGNVPESVRTVILAGEPLQTRLVQQIYQQTTTQRVFDCYGPSEDTTYSTFSLRSGKGPATIGRPIANTQIYILDAYLQPVPIGVPGELHIGGVGLARGYLNRAELTTEKFIANPFNNAPEARLYKTGDLARYLPDGNIEFLGRIDHQVKIRGFRIELGEIEVALAQHPAVRESVVLARGDVPGEESLAAYIVLNHEQTPTISEFRRFLNEKLPEYMVPSAFVMLDALPLTPNGKLDRRALPAPDTDRPELETAYAAPRTELEHFLANIWREILGIEKIGIYDNFFELGGDSLKGAVFVNKLQAELGEYLYIVALFDAPTIADLAAYLNAHYPDAVSKMCGVESLQRLESGPGVTAPSQSEKIGPSKVAKMRQLIRALPPREDGRNGVSRDISPASKNPPAIFILTSPRSGSTLLRVMLGGHPHLFAPPELDLLSFNTLEERKAMLSGGDSFRLEGTIRAIMELKGCDVEGAQRIMEHCEDQKLTTQEFYRRMQEWIGQKTLVDKSTFYALDLEILKRAETDFENPLYINLLRHPSGMIHSFEKARLDRLYFKDQHAFSVREVAELTWLICYQNILEFLKDVPAHRQYRVKFEDLVNQPRPTMEGICQFLNLEFHPDMLQPYKDKDQRMTDGIHPDDASRMVGDVKFHEHREIDSQVADRWKKDSTDDFLGDITWQVAETLGYESVSKSKEELADNGAELPRKALTPIQSITKKAEQVLAGLDQLSDEEVDSLLNDMVTEEEIKE